MREYFIIFILIICIFYGIFQLQNENVFNPTNRFIVDDEIELKIQITSAIKKDSEYLEESQVGGYFEEYTFYGRELLLYGNTTEADIDEIILSSFNKSLSERIKKNLVKTEDNINTKGLKFRGVSGDTACPYQIRDNLIPNRKYKRRHPDAIGIGVGKSGTGTLSFLDCHPNLVFRSNEPFAYKHKNFFQIFQKWQKKKRAKGQQTYFQNQMYSSYADKGGWSTPLTAKSEFLVEKTPMYSQQIDGAYIRRGNSSLFT